MKKLFTTLVALATITLSANAQSEYMMKVTKTNGDKISINAADVEQVTFQAPDAVDKLKQHVRTQLKTIAQNIDLSSFSIAAQSLEQFNENVLLSGAYNEQFLTIVAGALEKMIPIINEPQDAPEALSAMGIEKIIPIDLAIFDGTITVNEAMTYQPGTDGLIIVYTREQEGKSITNTLKFKGASSDKYQLIVPIPESIKSDETSAATATTALIINVPKQFDFTFGTNAFGGTDFTPITAKLTLDIQTESPYIAGLTNPFTIAGEIETNMPSQTSETPQVKKVSFSTSTDPAQKSTKSDFKFLKGGLPIAAFSFSGNLNPEQKIDLSKFDIATFRLLDLVTEMLKGSAMNANLSLMDDLAVNVKITDGLEAAKYTLASNQARHNNDKATLEAIAPQLSQVVNGTFTCKAISINDAPIKFQTEQFGVDFVNMPAIDLEGNGTYTPITKLYDKESLVYAVNINRRALEPMGDAVKIAGQLVRFVQSLIGTLVQAE